MAGEGTVQNSENEQSASEKKLKKEVSFKNADLNFEQERIKSFASWPVHFPVDPIRLAKAGFCYTGTEDEVVCFSCHGCIKDWNYGDVVLKKHAELFPDCDFVNNRSNNVPILKSSGKINGNKKNIEAIEDNITKPSECKSIINFDKMKLENERIKTFNEKWPLSYMNIAEIARAGFFYIGYEDKVQCPYCKGIVSNWDVGDDPLEEHVKHFPWCEYLSNCLQKKFNGKNWFQTNSHDVCGSNKGSIMPDTYNNAARCKLLDKSQQHINLERLGVHLHKGPAHPEQASLSARLRSFVSWPSSAPVNKKDLAEAGFFYIGIKDHTKCFHCNGGLCNWEVGDDPWIEHARWFCNCDFLRLNKGDTFIESCLKKYPKVSISTQSSSIHYPEMLLKKVDDAMRSDIVNYALETGMFPSYIVRAAVLRQIKFTGSNFSDIDELCIAVSYLKEEMEKEPFKMSIDDDSDTNVCQSIMKNCIITSDNESLLSCDVSNSTPESICQAEGNIKSSGIQQTLHVGQSNGDLSKDQCLCKICMDNEVGVVFLPCGHLLSCTVCAPALQFCPMCRKTIQATVRAYLN